MDDVSQRKENQLLSEYLQLKKGDLGAAITHIQQLVKHCPDFCSGWIELGRAYRARGNRLRSLEAFEVAATLLPNDIACQLEIVDEKLYLGQLKDVEVILDCLLTTHPDHTQVWMKRGRLHQKRQNHAEAMICFQRVLALNPKHMWAGIQIANEYCLVGSFEDAEEQLNGMLEHHPDNIELLLQLGGLQQRCQQWERAIAYYEQVLQVVPNAIGAKVKIAETLRQLSRFEDAEQSLCQFLESHPQNYGLMMEAGRLQRQQEHREKALYWFQLASHKAPSPVQYRDAQLAAIKELYSLYRLDEALNAIDPVLKQWPDNIGVSMLFGELQTEKLEFTPAIEAFQHVLHIDPYHVDAHYHLAQTLFKSGQKMIAITLLEESHSDVRNNPKIQRKLGNFYLNNHDYAKAMECFQAALATEPANLWSNLAVANALQKKGAFDTAKQQLLQALKYHPQNLQILLQLADLEYSRQRLNEAIDYYEQAQAIHVNSSEPALKIAEMLIESDQLDHVECKLQDLLQDDPNDAQFMIQLGRLEQKRGNQAKSLQWFINASQVTSNIGHLINAQLSAAQALANLGKLDEALQKAQKLSQRFPNELRLQMCVGKILQQQVKLDEAATIYQAILNQDPRHLWARLAWAKILSQRGQENSAFELLEETYSLLGPDLDILLQLGQLAIAQENWQAARQWNEKAYKEYPVSPRAHIALATVMVLQGEVDHALALLFHAQKAFPHVVNIPIKTAEIKIQLGHLEDAMHELEQLQSRFPEHIQITLLLVRAHIQRGNFSEAEALLSEVKGDCATLKNQIEQFRGEISLQQYTYEQAEQQLRAALPQVPTLHERNRLATVLMALGKLDEASTQLRFATEEIGLRVPPGKVPIPLISHLAQIIRAFQINPYLLMQLKDAEAEQGEAQLFALAQIIIQDSTYFGAYLTLAKTLRLQGILTQLRDLLPSSSSDLPSIPRSIVQYWDAPEPPKDVQTLNQTWKDQNPNYIYQLFSYQDALDFLIHHYSGDDRVLRAFRNCDQPATQADFFRLAYLNKMGGFYADADDRCCKPLDTLLKRNPELIVLQEDFSCIGNNFIGCIPGQTTIRIAFYRAVQNLLHYSADGPWFQTGPGLVTCAFGNTLLPYLSYNDYHLWPRLWVLSQAEIRAIVTQHISLPYKRTERSWSYSAYHRSVGSSANRSEKLDFVPPC